METEQLNRKTGRQMIENKEYREKAIVVGVRSGRQLRRDAEDSMQELCALVEAAGADIAETVFCDLSRIQAGTFIGRGKVEEIAEQVKANDAQIVVFDVQLAPPQQRNLEKRVEVRIIDRAGIILDIFADRAATNEGKLQVELAQLEYRLPRLTHLWQHLGRLGAGIGTRGPGETQLEVDRRRIRTRLDKLRQDLTKIKKRRRLQRTGRQKSGIPTIAIVGYTNAGKSTLLNALTGANVLVKDQLFATLDPTIRQLILPNQQEVILSDTVGFISKLPHELVAAFHATLEEVIEADLLLHVVDACSIHRQQQIDDVHTVLKELKVDQKPMIMVYNKVDLDCEFQPGKIASQVESYAISAFRNLGIDDLLAGLMEFQGRHSQTAEFLIPYAESSVISKIRELCEIQSETFENNGVHLVVRGPGQQLSRFDKYSMKENAVED